MLTLAVNIAIMALALYAVLAYMSWGVSPAVQQVWDAPGRPGAAQGDGLILVELMLVTAIAVFFSTFSTPILSAALTFGFYVVGHFSGDLRNFQDVVDAPGAAWLARSLYWVLPNLAQFDIKAEVVHGRPVPFGYLGITVGYAAVYIAMLLLLSSFIFSRRDFK